jgi:hypothetical protein
MTIKIKTRSPPPDWHESGKVMTMDTNQTSNDLNHPPTDPALDALLDQAVSHEAPPMDPKLSRRIVAQTLPMLPHRGGVLARIVPGGVPTLMRVAAAVAIIVGAWVAVVVMNQDRGTVPQQPPVANSQSEAQFAAIESELEQIDRAVEQGNTLIDEQMDVLALRIDLASAESIWGAPGQDTGERLSDAVTGFEFDLFSADAMLLMDESSALF